MTFAAQIAGYGDAVLVTGQAGQNLSAADLAPDLAGGLAGGLVAGLGPAARVALCLHDPADLIRALAALDGSVAAILLLSSSFAADVVTQLAANAACSLIVSDRSDVPYAQPLSAILRPMGRQSTSLPTPVATGWLMTTSGTTGLPKIVPHTLKSLARSVYRFGPDNRPVWGLVYDPTRFAGMQVTLQALIGGGRLVAVDTHTPLAAQVALLADQAVTHLSATPTLWRRLLMVPGHRDMALRQVTLGGEIVDQPTLNAVRAAFPGARISHIYASTEAGVGFSVTDGQTGFPAAYLDSPPAGVRLKIVDGILWLRPPVTALTALTAPVAGIEVDAQGYIRSGDQVDLRGDRITFLGRENGLINIGGVKVYPETVEAVIQTVPGVALVQVSAKRSPVTGALVLAEVQLTPGTDPAVLRPAIIAACKAALVREAVPGVIRFVDGFATNAAGKLVRTTGVNT